MDVCVRLFYVCAVLCVGSGVATGWSLVEGVLPTLPNMYRVKKLRNGPVGPCEPYEATKREVSNLRQ
jgi:hypothetical protein